MSDATERPWEIFPADVLDRAWNETRAAIAGGTRVGMALYRCGQKWGDAVERYCEQTIAELLQDVYPFEPASAPPPSVAVRHLDAVS